MGTGEDCLMRDVNICILFHILVDESRLIEIGRLMAHMAGKCIPVTDKEYLEEGGGGHFGRTSSI